MTAADASTRLRSIASADLALMGARFFKSGPGQYAEGDIFIGVRVPEVRKLAKEFRSLPLKEIETLLRSPIHEERLLSLLILVLLAPKADTDRKKEIFDLYLSNTKFVNNWDLVDTSAPVLVGGWLLDKERNLLVELAGSENLWERRIAILATQHFIRHGQFTDTLTICRMLLSDKHDLIHKAMGWMLREVGKKHEPTLVEFLEAHVRQMPRTTLRYAIERLPPEKQNLFLLRKKMPGLRLDPDSTGFTA